MSIFVAAPGRTWPPWTCITARVFGRCEAKNGIAPFDRLLEQVMTRPPYNDACRVFWLSTTVLRMADPKPPNVLRDQYPRLTLVPRQLVESGRDLLLDRATQGSLSERPPEPGSARTTTARFSVLLATKRAQSGSRRRITRANIDRAVASNSQSLKVRTFAFRQRECEDTIRLQG
jgi:hypothetical protein